jgi:alcohol dehydrogenase (cytochrome c)
MKSVLIVAGALVVTSALAGGGLYLAYPVQVTTLAAMGHNYLISWSAPPGTTTTEINAVYKVDTVAASSTAEASPPKTIAGDWPSYNRTLASDRYSELSQIDTKNARKLKILCTYDVDEYTAFECGLIVVDDALIGTTEFDIFSLDPATCALNWRTHEDYPPALLPSNRGAAYLDSMLFRGTQDGRVLAYDFKTGRRVWETTKRSACFRRSSLVEEPYLWTWKRTCAKHRRPLVHVRRANPRLGATLCARETTTKISSCTAETVTT